jgi:ADP-ribose pyrophosphatase
MPDNDAHLRWKELSRRTIASGAIFDLFAAERMSHGGRTGEFWILEARDWVTVVPVVLDSSGRPGFMMVRQYRHGADRITTEFPSGLIERGEDPAAAAARELREETGHRAARLIPLGNLLPNPAFMTNCSFTFAAEGLQPDGAPSLDELEALDTLTLPVEEVYAQAGRGELVNAMTIVALAEYQRYRREWP